MRACRPCGWQLNRLHSWCQVGLPVSSWPAGASHCWHNRGFRLHFRYSLAYKQNLQTQPPPQRSPVCTEAATHVGAAGGASACGRSPVPSGHSSGRPVLARTQGLVFCAAPGQVARACRPRADSALTGAMSEALLLHAVCQDVQLVLHRADVRLGCLLHRQWQQCARARASRRAPGPAPAGGAHTWGRRWRGAHEARGLPTSSAFSTGFVRPLPACASDEQSGRLGLPLHQPRHWPGGGASTPSPAHC